MGAEKEIKLGNIYGFTGGNYAGNVYDKSGLSPCLSTFGGGNQQPMIVEVEKVQQDIEYECVAMRGRPVDGSDYSGEIEQRLEPNGTGVVNTLTSVQKDNLILEKIRINQPTAAGFIERQVPGAVDLNYPTSKTRRGRVQEGGTVCPTICAEEMGICWIENGSPDEYTLAYEDGDYIYYIRIRKLTPRECWRLMGFSDRDFDKAQEVNSNTQLYKQAGNSIVKNVLTAVMGQLFEGKENIYREGME